MFNVSVPGPDWLWPLGLVWLTYFGGALVLDRLLIHGAWQKHRLVTFTGTCSDYIQQIAFSILNYGFFLPLATLLLHDRVLLSEQEATQFYFSPLSWGLSYLSVFAFEFVRYWEHRLLHSKYFYWIHCIHHNNPAKMTTFSTISDHPLEFLLTECISLYFGPFILYPIPFPVLIMWWVYFVLAGLNDHSMAYHPQLPWLLDGRYHFLHHTKTVHNYSDVPWFDNLFGTFTPDVKLREQEEEKTEMQQKRHPLDSFALWEKKQGLSKHHPHRNYH